MLAIVSGALLLRRSLEKLEEVVMEIQIMVIEVIDNYIKKMI